MADQYVHGKSHETPYKFHVISRFVCGDYFSHKGEIGHDYADFAILAVNEYNSCVSQTASREIKVVAIHCTEHTTLLSSSLQLARVIFTLST